MADSTSVLKVFISYSWSSQGHQELVRSWAERLVNDGVDVVLDQFDLVEGHDKYAFMESMVTNSSITHVLLICDKVYAEKADARRSGVGTESQIISQEVYNKVTQTKFVPIVVEFDSAREPYLPVFLKSRVWINFSSPEYVNENWEKLIRHLNGKPYYKKPTLGKKPAYLEEESVSPSSPMRNKLSSLKQAVLGGRINLPLYRTDFMDSLTSYVDSFRTRTAPRSDFSDVALATCQSLKPARDAIVDWIEIEGLNSNSEQYIESIVSLLEVLLDLKSRPPEINQWNDAWFDAHAYFCYETFIYMIAKLIKLGKFHVLNVMFKTHYLFMSNRSEQEFVRFNAFCATCKSLQGALNKDPKAGHYYSPAAELLHRMADRSDLPFGNLMEAEALIFLMAIIEEQNYWYPGTLHYQSFGNGFPFFVRAAQHKHFQKLMVIVGDGNATAVKERIRNGIQNIRQQNWLEHRFDRSIWNLLKVDNMDTID